MNTRKHLAYCLGTIGVLLSIWNTDKPGPTVDAPTPVVVMVAPKTAVVVKETKYLPVSPPLAVRATYYQALSSQTDSSPLETYDGSHIKHPKQAQRHRWLAVSHDLLQFYRMGDTLMVQGLGKQSGLYVVHDLMHHRHRRRIDILIGQHIPATQHWQHVRIYRVVAGSVFWR